VSWVGILTAYVRLVVPYEIIAVSPSSPQEMFDFTVWAFNLSEQYRVPVMIMADEVVGHIFERVVIPPEDEIEKRLTGMGVK